jgi:phosphoribosyl-AMP cyclohydrolase
VTERFPPPGAKHEAEAGDRLSPRFDEHGLVTAVVTDAGDGTVLMVAHMNAEALALTLETGVAHYFSRSRQALWRKGDTSGSLQRVEELRVDCDQDAVWIRVRVEGSGASCHTGRRSCFYRAAPLGRSDAPLVFVEAEPMVDPATLYGGKG